VVGVDVGKRSISMYASGVRSHRTRHQGRNFTPKSDVDRGRGHMASAWSASL